MKKRPNHIGVNIGATYEGIVKARAAIIDILNNIKADQATKIVALETLRVLCRVEGTTVTNCNFKTGDYYDNRRI